MDLRNTVIFSQIVAHLLIVDARLTDAENDFIHELMEDLDLTPEERDTILNSANARGTIASMARNLDNEGKARLIEALREVGARNPLVSNDHYLVALCRELLA